MKIKQGTILALTKGEYSDYCLMGHVKALRDFDSDNTRVDFVAQLSQEDKQDWAFDLFDKYAAWLIQWGYVKDYDSVIELYLGDYSSSLLEVE